LPECYVERLDALKHYYYALSNTRADLVIVREGNSRLAAITLRECAEDKLFSLLPREKAEHY
jgi:hypothetical protein